MGCGSSVQSVFIFCFILFCPEIYSIRYEFGISWHIFVVISLKTFIRDIKLGHAPVFGRVIIAAGKRQPPAVEFHDFPTGLAFWGKPLGQGIF